MATILFVVGGTTDHSLVCAGYQIVLRRAESANLPQGFKLAAGRSPPFDKIYILHRKLAHANCLHPFAELAEHVQHCTAAGEMLRKFGYRKVGRRVLGSWVRLELHLICRGVRWRVYFHFTVM